MSWEGIGVIAALVIIIPTFLGVWVAHLARRDAQRKDAAEKLVRDLLAAEEKGKQEQIQSQMKSDIDAAHRQLRGEVMPRIEALEKGIGEANLHFGYIKEALETTAEMLQRNTETTMAIATDVASLRGEHSKRYPESQEPKRRSRNASAN